MCYSSPLMAVLTPKSVIQLTAFIAFETGRKLNSVCRILLLVPLQTYIWHKKNWVLLTDLLKAKNNMFLPDNCLTQKRIYSLNTHHKRSLDVSRGNFNMAIAPYRYTPKRIAKRWRSKNVITSMGSEFSGVLFSFFR